jgi:sigma-B regulation protein RsbU (phosphoserine phosphatase)
MIPDICQTELEQLKKQRIAYQAQIKLLENFVAMAHSVGETGMLKAAMRKTLHIAVHLTDACCGSLFLFDNQEAVAESILAQNGISDHERERLVGKVIDDGLAGWVRRHRKIGIVHDAKSDERWVSLEDQPYRTRSALAVPILRGEMLFGILTLMHPEPGHFKDTHTEIIQMTTDQIALVLENIQLYQQLDASYKTIQQAKEAAERYSAALDQELEKGRRLQQDFLPETLIDIPGWRVFAWFEPAQQVAGDFYDVFSLPSGLIGWVVGDVCDKGVGAALYMGLFRSLIRLFSGQTELDGIVIRAGDDLLPAPLDTPTGASDFLNPLKAVPLTNRYIVENHGRNGIFASILFGVIDLTSGTVAYINAGHEEACIVGEKGISHALKPSGPSVGLSTKSRFDVRWLTMAPGDILISHTDGVTEALSSTRGLFGRQRLRAIIDRGGARGDHLMERLKMEIREFCAGEAQSDDITVLAIQRLGPMNHG